MAEKKVVGRPFKKGHPGGPGRPTRKREELIVNAIKNLWTEEEIQTYLQEAMDLAKSQRSTRGMMQVLRFVTEYTAGKPVPIENNSNEGFSMLAAFIQGQAQEEKPEEKHIEVKAAPADTEE